MDEKEYIRVAEERASKFKDTPELLKGGSAGVAREKLLKAEKEMQPDLDFAAKIDEKELYITYETDDRIIPDGTVLFNALLLTCNRKGSRPIEKPGLKAFHARDPYERQFILKVGKHVDSDMAVGKEVLIDVMKYLRINAAPPVIILPVNGQNREFLVISDRDVKYVY